MAKKAERLVYVVDNTPDTRNAEPEHLFFDDLEELKEAALSQPDDFENSRMWTIDLNRVKEQALRVNQVVIE